MKDSLREKMIKTICFAVLILSFIKVTAQTQIGQDIDGESSNDRFGQSVRVSSDGSIVAIGARSANVRIFENQGGTWVQIGQNIEESALGESSKNALSLSSDGSMVAIGVRGNDSNGNNAGQVRVFENQGDTWVQVGQGINGEAAGDNSGSSVSLSSDGSIVAIGAFSNDDNGNSSGHARVFQNQGGTWVQVGQDIDGEAAGDNSGTSVHLSSDGLIIAIAAKGHNISRGHVRIFENQDGTWVQIGQEIEGEFAIDQFGHSLGLSSDGSIVAIGSERSTPNNQIDTPWGHVEVYQNQDGTWVQIGQDIYGEQGEFSALSLSLSDDGSLVAISAPGNDGNGSSSGTVRVFQNQGGTWVQVGENIDGEAANNGSGNSISFSSTGAVLAIGAKRNFGNGNFSGHVRLFSLEEVLGIEDTQFTTVGLYPNPAFTMVNLTKPQGTILDRITIYDITGRFIQDVTINTAETTQVIDIAALTNGIYMIVVSSENRTLTKRLIVANR